MKKSQNIKNEFEKKLKKEKGDQKYILHLYVAGLSPRSQKAIDNVKKLCEDHLPGRYELFIQDIYQKPITAKDGQIIAIPTLVKELPSPLRKFLGDMSNTKKILIGMDIRTKEK